MKSFDIQNGQGIISEGTRTIKSNAFGNFLSYSTLRSVVIPDSVTRIGDEAFADCPALTSIVIPDSVTVIEHQAFTDCSGLTGIFLPRPLSDYYDAGFEGCENLRHIFVPAGMMERFKDCLPERLHGLITER